MKKLFLVLALAGVMAACGGEEKKAANDPKALAKEFAEAYKNNDDEAIMEIYEKYQNLSEEDQEIFDQEAERLMPDVG